MKPYEASQVRRLRDRHRSLDAGGKRSSAASPYSATPAEVPGPAPGTMTKAYVQMVGRMAYFWGWPLVYVYNQRTELTKVPEAGLLAGVMPISPMNQVGMLTGYLIRARGSSRTRTRMLFMGWAICLSKRSLWSFKCPTLATVSGRSRCTTHAPTR